MLLKMEVFLNVAWAVVALFLIELRRRTGSRPGTQQRNSLIGLALLLVILFPVISVSDDLWSIQFPAETDTALRRSQFDAGSHTLIKLIALPVPALLAPTGFRWVRCNLLLPSTRNHQSFQCFSILNRPPPTA